VPAPDTRLAVDLSGGLIKVVAGAIGGPLRCGSGGTPTGSLVAGKVVDVDGVGSALRQLLARTEIETTHALIAASDAVATFRVLKLPPGATNQDVDGAVARELPLDPERMSTRWMDMSSGHDHRLIYAVSWDRSLIKGIADAARFAGLDPVAVDIKSACVARVVAEPACLVLDLASNPAEIVLIDGHIPQVWHSFRLDVELGDDIVPALDAPLRTVLRFYKRRRDTEFEPTAPIFISGEQVLSTRATSSLSLHLDHPVLPLPLPPRVPPDVRYTTYLTCLGLLMRRSA
jgi:hypothetical protein